MSDEHSRQIEVNMGDLKVVSKEFARLLEERVRTKVELNGNKLMLRQDPIRHLRARDVKIGTKHVLHHLGFSHDYRVLSENSRIRIVRVEEKRKAVKKETVPPNPAQTLPYLFPP